MRIKKITILLVIIIIISTLLFSGCVDKDSDEYRYDIKRFIGDYEMKEKNHITISLYNYTNYDDFSDYTHMGIWTIHEITEDGIYYYCVGENDLVIEFQEIKLDSNLFKEIHEKINYVGKKTKFNKNEIIFTDSSASFNYKNYYLSEGKTLLNIQLEENESNIKFIYMYAYYGYGGKEILFKINFTVEGTDGIKYRCYLDFGMTKI